MIHKIEIRKADIFHKSKVLAGITLKNTEFHPPIGFSISKAECFSENEIENNRVILSELLGTERKNLIFQKQIHSDISQIVDRGYPINESDALITNKHEVCLVISLADCCGILLYDRKKQIIGAIHSGWRSTAQDIVGKTIKKISDTFNSNPSDLLVWVTPCAGKEDYEVGVEVARLFPQFIEPKQNGKYMLDLKSAIKKQLLVCGVSEENIEISPESTISDLSYHSYRRDKSLSGRMAAFIMMK